MPGEIEKHLCLWRRCAAPGPYDAAKALSEHVEDAHNVQPSQGERYFCKWEGCRCKRQIDGNKHRADHLITHTGYKPHSCPSPRCSATFHTAHSLNYHVSTRHDETKPKTGSPSKSPANKNKRAGDTKGASSGGERGHPAKRRRLSDGDEYGLSDRSRRVIRQFLTSTMTEASEGESDAATAASTPDPLSFQESGTSYDYDADRANTLLRNRLLDAEQKMKRMQAQIDSLVDERASDEHQDAMAATADNPLCRWNRCPSTGPYLDGKALYDHLFRKHCKDPVGVFICQWEGCATSVATPGQRCQILTWSLIAHTTYKPYICKEPDCSKSFTRNADLLLHLRKHELSNKDGQCDSGESCDASGSSSSTGDNESRSSNDVDESGSSNDEDEGSESDSRSDSEDGEACIPCLWKDCAASFTGDDAGAAELWEHLSSCHYPSSTCKWDACGMALPHPTYMSHVRTHLPEWYRPFVCNLLAAETKIYQLELKIEELQHRSPAAPTRSNASHSQPLKERHLPDWFYKPYSCDVHGGTHNEARDYLTALQICHAKFATKNKRTRHVKGKHEKDQPGGGVSVSVPDSPASRPADPDDGEEDGEDEEGDISLSLVFPSPPSARLSGDSSAPQTPSPVEEEQLDTRTTQEAMRDAVFSAMEWNTIVLRLDEMQAKVDAIQLAGTTFPSQCHLVKMYN
ncbi:hypothetical protein AURDEDRAFT_152091 [Auricularia subglabra TFB-10046 SS5]|uniref:C2H2-type domain-containing protein n=1 Tax=Auricularia subglabra (strain TFB-10046 / SS5) TaxID=717982 RepID=J0D339_AURST|nr:hypothetical protein AURDEDRAFT_152091 [Auricularia subglabra TFB-10046 SS5]